MPPPSADGPACCRARAGNSALPPASRRLVAYMRLPGCGNLETVPPADEPRFGDVVVPVLGLQDMRTAKRTAGRLKDLADLKEPD